jgi:hypothetical protein
MSTGKLFAGSKGSEARDTLVGDLRQRLLQELAVRRVQLQQRLQHEAAVHQLRVRNPQLGRPMLAAVDQQQVDVDRPGRVPGRVRVAPELDLDVLARGEQAARREARVDTNAGVQEVLLPDRPGLGLRLVDGRAGGDGDAAATERRARGAKVREPVADVRAEAEPGLQSARSFQTSTVTSSTGSGIGGSGLVALTVTASAS